MASKPDIIINGARDRRPASIRTLGKEPAEEFYCPVDVLEDAIEGLAGCEETVSFRDRLWAGILDPNQVVEWVDRTKRLFAFSRGSGRSSVSEVPRGGRRTL